MRGPTVMTMGVRDWVRRLGIRRPPTDFQPARGNWDDLMWSRGHTGRSTRPDVPRTTISRADIRRSLGGVDYPDSLRNAPEDEGFQEK